jgi:hypothetical protein
LLGERPKPVMPFAEQLKYAKDHWPQIVGAFSSGAQSRNHKRLRAAIREHAGQLMEVQWPRAIRDLESFLRQQGLKWQRVACDPKALCYADSRIAVHISRRSEWHVAFADMIRDRDRWYGFDAIRRLVQWPDDQSMTGREMLEFIRAHWPQIVGLFVPEKSVETYERISKLE